MIFVPADPMYSYLIIGVLALVILGAAALYLMRRRKDSDGSERSQSSRASRLAYQPEARPVPAVPPGAIPRPARKAVTAVQPKEVDLIDGRADITDSLRALMEKFSFDDLTIATSDGLVFASVGSDEAQVDAARYSEVFANDRVSQDPGVILIGISHKGSDLVLIAKTSRQVLDETRKIIGNDTKDILNRWI